MLKTIQRRKFNPQENFSKKHFNTTDIYKNFFAAGEEAKLNSTSEMTLEKINAEIEAARRGSQRYVRSEKKMTRYVVIDTNAIVSAILKPISVPGKIIKYVADEKIIPLLDNKILEKYTEVLRMCWINQSNRIRMQATCIKARNLKASLS